MILRLEQQSFTTCTRLFLQVLGNPAQRLLAGPGAQVPALHLGGPGEHRSGRAGPAGDQGPRH